MKFNLVVAVWGDAFIRSLCEITFPSFLNARDLHAVSGHDLHILIYCRATEEQVIRGHAALRALPEWVTIAFFHIVPEEAANHYVAMAKAHAHAAMYSAAEKARAIIVPPDAVFAEGSLSRIVDIASAGKRALMVAAPRLRQVTAQDIILNLLQRHLPLSPRRLLKIGLEHLHPEMNRYFWTSQRFSTRPFLCFWELPGRGWLCRNFHLHPLMLDFSALTEAGKLEHDTIDGEFIGHFIGVWDDIFVEQDSDRLLMFTLTPDDVFYSQEVPQGASVDILRKTAYEDIVNPVHRWYFTKAIKFHADDLDAEWDALEEKTGRLVFDILSLERTPPPLPPRASLRQKVLRLFGRS
jgi:hypothetical protein